MSADPFPVIAAGAAARFYVLGAMEPTFTEAADRDMLVKALAKHSPSLAVAFLRGWVEHHPGRVDVLAWHRLIGDAAVEVGVAS